MRAVILALLAACSGAAPAPVGNTRSAPPPSSPSTPRPPRPDPAPVRAPPPAVFPPLASPSKVVVISTDDCGMVLGPVYFPAGSAVPDPGSTRVLDDTATMLLCLRKQGARLVVEVQGNADPAERDPLELSDLRAAVVRTALIGRSVPADALTVQGYGATQPAASSTTEHGRAMNRRVGFLVIRNTTTP